ncbi:MULTISPECIES: NAD(P)/FAD-dependent oxidoreductase [Pseudomonas]|uniref:FAD-dependent oxidoreductase n=2 Tax=Pseudomonas TaxID=286 RepID=A0ABY3PXW4_9PSED|nr:MULTISPECIES: FAD-binding oxidoreductase [Pseudomonas]QYY80579.1 FAD-dependent oxidoreductase [Pseudomonas germanica]UFP98782.1 FAD-dependent oxidoreductase [Pseudomonas fitomaticsae]
MLQWRNISLWMDQLEEPLVGRPSLERDLDVNVVIIGAGYTGLWTAYYLKRQAPELKIAIIEAQTAGFGASGRNGGWLMGNLLGENRLLAGLSFEQRRASFDLLHGIPDEVAQVIEREGIDCDYRKGGVLYCAARYPEQEISLRKHLNDLYAQGLTEADYRWLSPQQLAEQIRIAKPYGGIFAPHVATLHPAKLVRGLARIVEQMGVNIYENSPVTHWQSGSLRTDKAVVRASWVVPAVEGYAPTLPPLGRYQLPVQSLIVATEQLPANIWDEIGLSRGQAFGESSRQVTYGQRSADNRLVFGARGGYQFAGKLRDNFDLTDNEVDLRRYLFGELFPQLKDVRITHAWGGNLAMSRRFRPHMLCDHRSGIALSGGYGGEGVGASNLGGRTLADLILGLETPLIRQPWVIPQGNLDTLKAWEREPCRWLGYSAIIHSFVHEDQILANPGTASWRRRMASGIAGFMEGFMQ